MGAETCILEDFFNPENQKKHTKFDFMKSGLYQFIQYKNHYFEMINVCRLIITSTEQNEDFYNEIKRLFIETCAEYYYRKIPQKKIDSISETILSETMSSIQKKKLCQLSEYYSFYILSSSEKYMTLDYKTFVPNMLHNDVFIERNESFLPRNIEFETQSLKNLYEQLNFDYNNPINLNLQNCFKDILDELSFSRVNSITQNEVDHIYPISKGGLNSLFNLEIIPEHMNSQKQNSIDFAEGFEIEYLLQEEIMKDVDKECLFYKEKYFVGDMRLIYMNMLTRDEIVLIFEEILKKIISQYYEQDSQTKRIILSNIYIMSKVDFYM